jgi:SAM-dependent methyltransferase
MYNQRFSPTSEYFTHLRMPLLKLIKGNPKKVLEIGCASGQTLQYVKYKGADLAVGIEIFPDVAEVASACLEVDRVIVGNIENIEIDFPPDYFDLIIAGFVIEHVADPWEVIKKLNRYIKPGGQLIGSLPNVRHLSVILPLIFQGKWEYQDEGIMDWTHLRFFTKSSISELLLSTDFQTINICSEISSNKLSFINAMTLNLMRDFLAYAYNFSAIKNSKDS